MCCRHISGAWQSDKCRLTLRCSLNFQLAAFMSRACDVSTVQQRPTSICCLGTLPEAVPGGMSSATPRVCLPHLGDMSSVLLVWMACDFLSRATGCSGDGAWSDSLPQESLGLWGGCDLTPPGSQVPHSHSLPWWRGEEKKKENVNLMGWGKNSLIMVVVSGTLLRQQ